ncbi:hypothetical protein ACUN7V_14415 [Quadrisphaera oryzae]|uniref:hypothetical protein n=1 Tax=Quadrisphaera TaxID=317661 RepID=UPI001645B30C|nr:hypothetical protein [Quadrisphaera sp. RL12-1S]MBC3760829.1 hypothetical protein [Quadrisphaera sp. RL12-1S]
MPWNEPIDPTGVARAIADDVQVFRPEPGTGPVRLPSWARFYLAPAALVVVVQPGLAWNQAEQALAYGLHHSEAVGVPLALAFPEEAGGGSSPVRASRVRAAYLRPGRVSVWTYGPVDGAHPCRPLTREEAQVAVREASTVLRGQVKPLPHDHAEDVAAALARAVDELTDLPLVPTPRSASRTWTYRGLRVLSVMASTDETVVRTGVHSTDRRLSHEGRHAIRPGALSDEFARAILEEVREACAGRAVAKESEQRAEHWFSSALPALLPQVMPLVEREVGRSVLREVPTYRPAGGTGFIDLVALDDDGTLHVIETTPGSDPMLVLQGLDHLIWVEANTRLLLEAFGVARVERVVIDYVLADRKGEALPAGTDVMGPYAAASRAALADDVRWQVHVAEAWTSNAGRLVPVPVPSGR